MPSTFPTGTYGHMIVNTSGCVYYMRLNDVGPTTGDDYDSLSGTGSNVTWRQTGALAGDDNKSASFNGTSSYINFGNNAPLSGPFTVECWIRPTKEYSSGFGTFLSKENYNTPWSGWGFYIQGRSSASGYMRAAFSRLNGGTSYVSNTVYSTRIYPNVWTYMVVTYDGSTLRLYRNAVFEWDTPSAGGMNTSSYSFLAGAESNASSTYYSNYFQGGIDEIAIYNRALTQTEITNHYNRGITPPVQYLSLSDSDKFTSVESKTQTAYKSLSETRTISRTEVKTQAASTSLTDARTLTVVESSATVSAFGGTLEDFEETVPLTAIETRSVSASITAIDSGNALRTSERTVVTAAAGLSESKTINAQEDFLSRTVVRASAIFPTTLRRQSGMIHFITSKYVLEPYKILYEFNDVVPLEDDSVTPFVVVDLQDNPLVIGFVTTMWELQSAYGTARYGEVVYSATVQQIIVDVSFEVDAFPEVLAEFGLSRKEQD